MRLILFVGFLATLICLFAAGFSLAAVTDISYPSPIVVGSYKTYTVVASGQATHYVLNYRCTENTVGNWISAGEHSSNKFALSEQRVGNFDIKGFALEPEPGTMPPTTKWYSRQEAIQVNGPTVDKIDSGLNVNSVNHPWMTYKIEFTVWSGDDRVWDVCGIDGIPKTRVTASANNYDSGWVDDTGDILEWANSKFVINFHHTADAAFNALAIGAVASSLTIQNRFYIDDCHNEQVTYTFLERNFQVIKTGASTVKVVEVTP